MAKIMAVNAGSSSIKFQLLEMPSEEVIASGIMEKIGTTINGENVPGIFTIKYNGKKDETNPVLVDHAVGVEMLLEALVAKGIVETLEEITGVGHRVVQGGEFFKDSCIVDDSVIESLTTDLHSAIILETAYVTTSFPVNQRLVSNYTQQVLKEEAPDLITKYSLDNYLMKVQSLERTFIDKIFAICDYYLQDKTTRHSRHLYDIHKLMPLLKFNNEFQKLVADVRNDRSKSPICISAAPEININTILEEIIQKNKYREDYNKLTIQLLKENITYDETITTLKKIIDFRIF